MEVIKNNKVYGYYSGLPSWAKGVVVIGVLGGGYLIVRGFINRIRRDAERKKAEQEIQNAKNELNQLVQQGEVTSYPKSTYDAFAQSLLDQFQGCDPTFGAPFGVVAEYADLSNSAKKLYDIVSQLNNNRDFLELVDSWNIRTYDDCGWWTGDIENASIYKAVSNELHSSEIDFINKRMRDRSGITYKF